MTSPFFLNANQAKEAFEAFVLPGIQHAIQENHVNRRHLHVTVLNPCVPFTEGNHRLPILFEYSIGDKAEWESWHGRTFDDFARGKAMISWRTGLSSREVVLTKPHLLRPGDVNLWGSSVYGGMVTGVSGVQPHFDEMFANMTSAAMVAEASHYVAERAQADPDAPDFLRNMHLRV